MWLINQSPMPNVFLFGEDVPSVASKQAELPRGLAKNLSNAQNHKNKVFKNLGSPRTGNDLRPQITSLVPDKPTKKLSVLSPQQGLLKPRLNNYL